MHFAFAIVLCRMLGYVTSIRPVFTCNIEFVLLCLFCALCIFVTLSASYNMTVTIQLI